MPNRMAVVGVLTQDVLGAQVRNGLIGETVNMPTDDYDRVEEAMTAVLERVSKAIDWARLLREASFRHMHLHPDFKEPDRNWNAASGVCGECLREALLADERGAQDWEKHPSTPLAHEKTDWPTVVSEELEHRNAAHWHPYKD
jgi:hypothetical protein